MHYSLYYENFKNENYASAKNDLLWILEHAPSFPPGSKNDDRNYKRIVELYTGLAEQAESEEKRAAHLDTAATHLTTAVDKMESRDIEYDPYAWELEKGRFLQQYGNALPKKVEGLNTAVAHYKQAFELNPEGINPYYIDQIIKSQTENGNQQELLQFLNKVESKRSGDSEVMSIVNETRQRIFGRNPKARIRYLEKQLEKSPDDVEVMTRLFEAYQQRGNIEAASKLADKLMNNNPSAEIVRQVAKMRLEDGRPQEAFKTYQKAMEQGAELRAQDYFNMGLAKQRSNSLAEARTYYRKAIDAQSDYGKAYIAVGDLYAKAVSDCGGSKMSRRDRAVYWLAVDMYQKAKQVDASISSTANSKINTYRQYFPSQEDIFFIDEWEAGNSVRIDYGCYSWINETTTVRRAP